MGLVIDRNDEVVLARGYGVRSLEGPTSVDERSLFGIASNTPFTAVVEERLVLRFTRTPSRVGDLEHWQHDTFVVPFRDRELRADAFLTFALDPDGRADEAKLGAVSPATGFRLDFQDLLLRPARENA